jgi:hypothetical protein
MVQLSAPLQSFARIVINGSPGYFIARNVHRQVLE